MIDHRPVSDLAFSPKWFSPTFNKAFPAGGWSRCKFGEDFLSIRACSGPAVRMQIAQLFALFFPLRSRFLAKYILLFPVSMYFPTVWIQLWNLPFAHFLRLSDARGIRHDLHITSTSDIFFRLLFRFHIEQTASVRIWILWKVLPRIFRRYITRETYLITGRVRKRLIEKKVGCPNPVSRTVNDSVEERLEDGF